MIHGDADPLIPPQNGDYLARKGIDSVMEFPRTARVGHEEDSLVRATIQEIGATTKKEMGAVIKAVQAKAAGRADGKTISSLVGKLLP